MNRLKPSEDQYKATMPAVPKVGGDQVQVRLKAVVKRQARSMKKPASL